MNKQTYKLTLITPCFCAGADQGHAEIRPASIRGELRWWFRVLGGTAEQEREIFGGVHGDPQASKLVVRVSDAQSQNGGSGLPKDLTFFTSSRNGVAIAPKSTFRLHFLLRQSLQKTSEDLLSETIEVFLQLGSIGLRTGRGCGAFLAGERVLDLPYFEAWAKSLRKRDVWIHWLDPVEDAQRALEILEITFKEFRSASNLQANDNNALGWVKGDKRHSSCLRLRPVKVTKGILPVLFYTERPLGENAHGIKPKLEAYFRKA